MDASPGMRNTGGRCLELLCLDFEVVFSSLMFG